MKGLWGKLKILLSREVTWTFRIWQWGLIIAALALAGLMFGCSTPHPQEGGGARTRIPQMPDEPPANIEQAMMQPENPEGSSEMTYEESRTVLHPDGRVETFVRKTGTRVGGSQDYARILKEYGKTEHFKAMMIALLLAVSGFFAYRNGWPLVALSLIGGAALSLFVAWWAGFIGVVVGAGLYIGFKIGLPIDPLGIK